MNDNHELEARLDFIQRGRPTRRYHTMEMLEYQRVDAHGFGVAMFTTIIVPVAAPERRARLLMAGLTHDLAEHKVSDIPAPAKRELGIRRQFNEYEDALLDRFGLAVPLDMTDSRVLKLADAADGAAHCIVDRAKGNILAKECFYNFWGYLNDELRLFNPMRDERPLEAGEPAVRRWIARNWTEANGGTW